MREDEEGGQAMVSDVMGERSAGGGSYLVG